jgi:hypothetical protein
MLLHPCDPKSIINPLGKGTGCRCSEKTFLQDLAGWGEVQPRFARPRRIMSPYVPPSIERRPAGKRLRAASRMGIQGTFKERSHANHGTHESHERLISR